MKTCARLSLLICEFSVSWLIERLGFQSPVHHRDWNCVAVMFLDPQVQLNWITDQQFLATGTVRLLSDRLLRSYKTKYVMRRATLHMYNLVTCVMKIRNVAHKGLRRFIKDDNTAALQPALIPKLRRILSFLQDMEREEELRTVPNWKAHQLVGERKGVWSLSVTKNWRITFRIDQTASEIVDLDYEDYH